jgi:superfamily II DNA or RNA helicase
MTTTAFPPGSLVRARDREWVVLPSEQEDVLRLRPLGGGDSEQTLIYLPLEPQPPDPASFPTPDPSKSGTQSSGLLLRDALRLKLRAGAGPFRSLGNLAVEPRAYQLVPLLMALKQETVRLLIADEVGLGKTIEALLIARELLDRGEIQRLTVICPPHLCEKWQLDLDQKFNLAAEIVRPGTAQKLDRGLPPGRSLFEVYPITVVSLDFIKAEKRRAEFLRACPEFVIVDEAHSCVQGKGTSRHQRYSLLRDLANDPRRHLLLLTATPHSGDDEAFHNLLGLLEARFQALLTLPEGEARRQLRDELSAYFVQRRRPDIQEWQDAAIFPDRQTSEQTYQLSGEWGQLFERVIQYSRELVARSEGASRLQQRMTWWATLALLRCISSSPAAAAMALRTRLQAVSGDSEATQISELDEQGAQQVFDGDSDADLTLEEAVPAGVTDLMAAQDASNLAEMIAVAERLRGPDSDPKLKLLIAQVKKLLKDGFRPVIFCRYIATANYVAEALASALPKKTAVHCVTGELPPEERASRIEGLAELAAEVQPVLVATDCLSEGIDLQQFFDAVVHYDLTWNPTRHEQREGRVDRFGQGSPTVRALMIYGKNNPVDEAVLKVILRKAETIRKELGVTVPLPEGNVSLTETLMQSVLSKVKGVFQQLLDLGDQQWQSAKEKAKQTRTIFAQRRLKPAEVLPEWEKSQQFLGGAADVERLVRLACDRLGSPLAQKQQHWELATAFLPQALQERLASHDLSGTLKLNFAPPYRDGALLLTRSHPLVMELADFLAEAALAEERPELAARCSAIRTDVVVQKTVLLLVRLRYQLNQERFEQGRYVPLRQLLVEECQTLHVAGTSVSLLSEPEALPLLRSTPVGNLADGQRQMLIEQAIAQLPDLAAALTDLAHQRAAAVEDDHRRVRLAANATGLRFKAEPCLPVDVIGIYILLPVPRS